MRTTYQAELSPALVEELAYDFPYVFGRSGLYWLEIHDWDEAMTLSGAVQVCEDEDGTYLMVDGWKYNLTEA